MWKLGSQRADIKKQGRRLNLRPERFKEKKRKLWRGKKCIQGWRNEYCFIAVQYPVLQQ
jgi:hypothetical protein